MRVLLINTSAGEGSVALADTEQVEAIVATEVLPGRTSSEKLVPAIRRLMEARGWRLRELAAVVVVHGPGSFTGVRVGLSAAKGLSEAGGVLLVAISRLALVAASGGEVDGVVHVALDAGRGEFYYGEYSGGQCVREALLHKDEVLSSVGGGILVVSETKTEEALAALHPRVVGEPSAADALPLAVERINAKAFDDVALVDANYLRRTDREIFAKQRAESAAK